MREAIDFGIRHMFQEMADEGPLREAALVVLKALDATQYVQWDRWEGAQLEAAQLDCLEQIAGALRGYANRPPTPRERAARLREKWEAAGWLDDADDPDAIEDQVEAEITLALERAKDPSP